MSAKPSSLLSATEPGVVALTAPTPAPDDGIISRAVLSAPGLRVTLFHFAAGQELTEHTSTGRALVQILTGSCEFSVDGQPRTLNTGDLLHLPPRRPHAVRAIEPFSMLLTIVPEPAAPAAP